MAHGGEERGVAQRLQVGGPGAEQFGAQALQVGDQPLQAVGVDSGSAQVIIERHGLALELLEDIGACVGAGDDGEDIEDARHRGAAAPLAA